MRVSKNDLFDLMKNKLVKAGLNEDAAKERSLRLKMQNTNAKKMIQAEENYYKNDA